MRVTERLFLTADRERLVRDDDPAAAFLYAIPGEEVPDTDRDRLAPAPGEGLEEPATVLTATASSTDALSAAVAAISAISGLSAAFGPAAIPAESPAVEPEAPARRARGRSAAKSA